MASPPEQPWSDSERKQLLSEIIRASHIQPAVLFDIISRFNIQPRWDDIPLPPGRSLNSCRNAYESIRRSVHPSVGPTMGPHTPTPMSAPLPALKRPYYEGPYSAGLSGREIRPKPSASGTPIPQPSPTEPPPKRKRGRPTKAEALAKAEAAAATVESVSSIIRRAPPITHGPVISPVRELKPTAPTTTSGMPIAAMLTPVQGSHKSASQSSSSSGKRRRAISPKSEPDDGTTAAASALEPEYESPYARMGGDRGGGGNVEGEGSGGPEDTPARTAERRYHPSSPRRTAPLERPPSAEKVTPRYSPPRPS